MLNKSITTSKGIELNKVCLLDLDSMSTTLLATLYNIVIALASTLSIDWLVDCLLVGWLPG